MKLELKTDLLMVKSFPNTAGPFVFEIWMIPCDNPTKKEVIHSIESEFEKDGRATCEDAVTAAVAALRPTGLAVPVLWMHSGDDISIIEEA